LQSLVGLRGLSPMAQLACDTSGNGTLSAFDAAFILQSLVGLVPGLPVTGTCGSDWAFVPMPVSAPNQRLIQPQLTSGNCQHGAIALEPLAGNTSGQNFAGILFGDCTGNWQPPAGATGAVVVTPRRSQATVRMGSAREGRNGRVRFPVLVQSAEPFHALISEVSYDASRLRLTGVHLFKTARAAMVQYNANTPGTVLIATASADPMARGQDPALVLDFARRKGGRLPRPHVRSLAVDEQGAAQIAPQ